MKKEATIPGITPEQIDVACDIFRNLLAEKASAFPGVLMQHFLSQPSFGIEWLGTLKSIGGMIHRRVRVDRSLSPQQAIESSGLVLRGDESVLATMPRGEGEEVDVFFFQVDPCDLSGYRVRKEYERRGLKPDPYAQMRVNSEDPDFCRWHRNACHWKADNEKWGDNWSVAIFDGGITIYSEEFGISDNYWFGGVFI